MARRCSSRHRRQFVMTDNVRPRTSAARTRPYARRRAQGADVRTDERNRTARPAPTRPRRTRPDARKRRQAPGPSPHADDRRADCRSGPAETARDWGRRQAARSPRWSDAKWRRVAQLLGIELIDKADNQGARKE
jgi:hypothetical protein